MKVLLILVDGMRPDSLEDVPLAQEFAVSSLRTMRARTVMPSLTLPCHMSLFHSIPPEEHGVFKNEYPPQPHPEHGLFESLKRAGKKGTMCYSWEELRDVVCPGMMYRATYIRGVYGAYREPMNRITDESIRCMREDGADFIFMYLGEADEVGHKVGWMSSDYLESIAYSWELIDRALKAAGDEYTVIVTADHGGHGLGHGEDIPEDMTVPLFIRHRDITPGEIDGDVSIMDLAPTVAALIGVPADENWKGRSLL